MACTTDGIIKGLNLVESGSLIHLIAAQDSLL
ncbi:hypothetical protein WH5701_02134 [Synechococcus sp. WH 5701]|nr:hypothetical protein WH5701_02134 [Synechococcus sp. WH 5701]